MENLQLALMKAAIYGGGASATVIVVILLWRQLVGIGRAVRKRPVWERVLIAWLVAALIAYGGSKPGGGTNEVENGEAVSRPLQLGAGIWLPIRSGQETASTLSVTDEDLARGWRLWEVRTNADWSAAMPEGAALCTNWWLRGAYEDVVRIGIGDQGSGMSGWGFPFGSNEWDSAWAFTWGKLRFALRDRATEIAAVGAPMAAVPFCSRLWTAADTNGARLVTWENFTAGRIRTDSLGSEAEGIPLLRCVNAQIELRRNGDFVTRSNEVETVYHVIDDFDWDGDGIVNELDDAPYVYDGDYCGQDEEYREWVDGTVGWGLENGYYKLTVTVPGIDFRRRAISVGSERVVADQPGEYVFLLEKGVDYVFCIEPFSPDVRFSVADDLPSVSSPLMLSLGWGWWSDWTMDGGDLVFTPPSFVRLGHCRWMPTLQVTPSAQHLGPGDSPQTFTAELSDFAYAQSVRYEWSSDDWNISFSNPQSEETEIDVWDMPTWGEGDVWATVTIGTNELTSSTHFHYGEHRAPQVNVSLGVPNALLLNSNNVDSAKIGTVNIAFASDVETNGTLTLYCRSGADRIRLTGESTWNVTGGESFSVDVEGVRTSAEIGDVSLEVVFRSADGNLVSRESTLTVVQVGDVVLPGAPADGLVISTGTSVALDLDVLPEGVQVFLTAMYYVRRLRGDGTYTDWEYAAANYSGAEAIYNPSAGGIYQVQALVSPGWGAEDERYYRWEADEIDGFGIRCAGESKAFGVVDESWQLAVLNCAKGFFASRSYARSTELAGQYGFSRLPANTWKCNMFVAHRLRQCGLPVAELHTYWGQPLPPLANEWAGGIDLAGWERCSSVVEVQPGWVVACPSSEGSGHVGIVDFDGAGVAAGTAIVNRAYPGFIEGPCVYRKYLGTEE